MGSLHLNTSSKRSTSIFLEFLEVIVWESECQSEDGCVSVLATKIRLPNLKDNQCPLCAYVQFHISHPFFPSSFQFLFLLQTRAFKAVCLFRD